VALVEERVEVEGGRRRLLRQQLAQVRARIPCLLGQALDDPVGLVALLPGADECQQLAVVEQDRGVGEDHALGP
jgi:hypothetical protein